MRYIFIINGRDDKSAVKADVESMMSVFNGEIDYDIYLTKAPCDATRHVSLYCDLHKGLEVCFVACGGDGTINEVASGLVGADEYKCMAILARGTGNDFIKYYKDRDFNDFKKILSGEQVQIDIIRVNNRFAVNVCNFGFDAAVAETANKIRTKGAVDPYKLGVATAIFTSRFNHIKVSADGMKLNEGSMLLCTLANCNYVGGEFLCAPRAVNDDGLIEVCLIKSMTLIHFLKLLPIYTKGEHLDNPAFSDDIVYRRAKKLEIDSSKEIELCLDGELILGKHFDVSILQKAIRLILPSE